MAEVNVSIESGRQSSSLARMSEEEFDELRLGMLENGAGCGPRVIDLEITGACPWRCEWCWGPDHGAKDELSGLEWARAVDLFATLGTERFTITGGEPLMSKNLETIIQQIIKNKLEVTLSTSGAGLLEKGDMLEALNSASGSVIGLPLDGSDMEANSKMRLALNGSNEGKNFTDVIDCLKVIQDKYPNIGLTVRTVVSSVNEGRVFGIPQTLQDAGVDLAAIRWKVYQLNPNDGPRNEQAENYAISDTEFAKTRCLILDGWHDQMGEIDFQSIAESEGRYIFVSPNGDVQVPAELTERMMFDVMQTKLNLRDRPAEAAEWISFFMEGWEFPKLFAQETGHYAVDMYFEEVLGPRETLFLR